MDKLHKCLIYKILFINCSLYILRTYIAKVIHIWEVIGMSDGGGYKYGGGFALIVVLFILLIIIGATAMSGYCCDDGYGHGGYGY